MLSLQEEMDPLAGFLLDLIWVIIIFAIGALVYIIIFDTRIVSDFSSVFWGTLVPFAFFLQLQTWMLVKIPRHGWKNSKTLYEGASLLFLLSMMLSSVASLAQHYLGFTSASNVMMYNLGLIAAFSPLLTFLVGALLELVLVSSFTRNFFGRDKEVLEVLRKHSRVYRALRL